MPADVANEDTFKPSPALSRRAEPGAAGSGVRVGDILVDGERPEDNTAAVAAAEARLAAATRAESAHGGSAAEGSASVGGGPPEPAPAQ